LVTRTVQRIEPEKLEVLLDGEERVRARTVVLATSVAWRRVAIDGADELIGKGVYYGAARSEADPTHGLDAHLIGAGNSAGQAALFFANHARSVTLVVRGDSLGKSMSQYLIDQLRRQSNINSLLDTEVKSRPWRPKPDSHRSAQLRKQGSSSGEMRGLFVFIGADAETGWLPPEIARDARGYVLTGDDVVRAGRWSYERDPLLLETSVPGVFACGDVRLSPVKPVAAAVGEGSIAIAFVHQFLQKTAH
jgi:thioredoxin reductase (NADPH)